ncbi:TauD/TfdA family dioxygenase [Gordonia sp. 852002-50395_SCH5434458]|uniref:TauD/TfdA family dioxygenase n=1 Tax=Gordonia sp. 852002-50395_SCH5434458 TaxID=1834090 RepID=UPI0009D1BD7C|nr:TauD/TfdA family dioxygenase [Gordonia sp. 852002-50395_SCH5434458]SKX69168.1 Taurine catabolism dioxygenase TauD, TfdA family [Mycobacteroides abscessus subsp. abscessus]
MTTTMLAFPADDENGPNKPWPTVFTRTVGDQEGNAIAAVAAMMGIDALADPEGYVRQARLVSAHLPADLRQTLVDFEYVGDGSLLIRGLKIGPIPSTPQSPADDVTHRTLLANTTALFVSVIANLVGYRAESWGRICQCIVPTEADMHRQTSTGSETILESHTEQAFNLVTRPDVIALGCNRGDPNAATYVLSARALQRHLPSWAVGLLREQKFYTRVDPSFIDGGVPDEIRGPLAVLGGPDDDPILTYDEDLMWSDSPEHQAALALVKHIWTTSRESVVLQPGDVLLIDNSRAIHGRSAFHPQFDGGDRWLCRLQGVYNLVMTRHARRGASPIIEINGC